MNWVAVKLIMEVATAAQTKIGIRKASIPLARIRSTVTSKLSAPRMDDQPASQTPIKNICIPIGAFTESGGYPVQPVSKPPKARLESNTTAAGTATQKEKA